MADAAVTDRETEYVFVAIWPAVRQDHVSALLDEYPTAIARNRKVDLIGAEALGAVRGGRHPEIDDFGRSCIAPESTRFGRAALAEWDLVHGVIRDALRERGGVLGGDSLEETQNGILGRAASRGGIRRIVVRFQKRSETNSLAHYEILLVYSG
jgi:hypothetical protein